MCCSQFKLAWQMAAMEKKDPADLLEEWDSIESLFQTKISKGEHFFLKFLKEKY